MSAPREEYEDYGHPRGLPTFGEALLCFAIAAIVGFLTGALGF